MVAGPEPGGLRPTRLIGDRSARRPAARGAAPGGARPLRDAGAPRGRACEDGGSRSLPTRPPAILAILASATLALFFYAACSSRPADKPADKPADQGGVGKDFDRGAALSAL